jgi:hypothetical protein
MSAALEKIRADMERHRKLFDLSRDNLGRDLCKAATDGVQENIANQVDPKGAPWPSLTFGYSQWKAEEYPGRPMGVLEGLMSDPDEVAGELDISENQASVTYGKTEQARTEAEWFQEGKKAKDGTMHQPPRPFWGFNEGSLKKVAEILDDRFRDA